MFQELTDRLTEYSHSPLLIHTIVRLDKPNCNLRINIEWINYFTYDERLRPVISTAIPDWMGLNRSFKLIDKLRYEDLSFA